MNSKILAATAAITAGVIISSAFMINNNKSNYIYSQIVTKNPDFKEHKASDIIVGMITEAGNDMNPTCNGIFLVPPTTDYETAYLNAVSCFENVNPSHGRGFNSYHCVYADGRIDFKSVISSESVSSDTEGAKRILVFENDSRGSQGKAAKTEERYLKIQKDYFNLMPSVDKAYEKSYECYHVPNAYIFLVYTLDGRSSLHSNKELYGVKADKADINIKASFLNGKRTFEGLEKIYNLETLNADIFNPETDVKERYAQLPKDIK